MNKIFLIFLFICMLFVFGLEAAFAQFIQQTNRSLFSDVKAFKEGDAIMILIVEDTQANNSAETDESRNTDLNAGVTYSGGNTNFSGQAGLSTGNTFKGQGQNSRNETIRSQLSARITGVETNGNLKIEGTRTTKVNGETQKIIIKGVVRPVDVMANNSIYSYNILDLTLLIDGDGNVSKIQEPGLITKFLRFLF
jgi:flagellar L-ring protein FlgH